MTSDPAFPASILASEIFDALPDTICSYIRFLESTTHRQQVHIQELQVQLQEQQSRIQQLEARLSKDSSNSGKPPSSDGLKRKPKSRRGKSDKKPGGQQGRTGKGLAQVKNPDVVVTHTPQACKGCGSNLDAVSGQCAEIRQVFEIPKPKVKVTEHRALDKRCPCCRDVTRGSFPENVRGPVQYGDRVRALSAYFTHQHFVPVDRVCEILEDVFGVALSPGTCANIDEHLFANLETFEANVKAHLLTSPVLNFDETGIRCEKKLAWIHVASSNMATLYMIHAKRGQEAMEALGILAHYQGTAVHDHWHPYFSFQQLEHGLCNAHHLRELTFIHEQQGEEWAKHMIDFLVLTNREVEKHILEGKLPSETLLQIEQNYKQILTMGFAYHALQPPLPKGKRGRQKQRDGKNLLDRLDQKRDCVLRFARDFSVPFTNNQGERDIRMVKLKQKVSGSFRALRGGQIFCRIRGYISTARKQGWNIWDVLAEAVRSTPRLLNLDPVATQTVAA